MMWRVLVAIALLAGAAGAGLAARAAEPVTQLPSPTILDGHARLPEMLHAGGLATSVALVGLDDAIGAGAVLLHVGPHLPAGALDRHLLAGGEAWIVTDNTTANAWLGQQGIGIDAHRIIDDGPTQIVGASQAAFTLPPPRHLVFASQSAWSTLLSTTPSSHIDLDGDGQVDAHEPGGPFAVAAARSVGPGRLVVVVAPAIFHDEGPPAAHQWVQRMAREAAGRNERAVIDETWQGVLPEESAATAAARWGQHARDVPNGWREATWAGLGVLGIALVMSLPASRGLGEHRTHDPVRTPRDALAAGGRPPARAGPRDATPASTPSPRSPPGASSAQGRPSAPPAQGPRNPARASAAQGRPGTPPAPSRRGPAGPSTSGPHAASRSDTSHASAKEPTP